MSFSIPFAPTITSRFFASVGVMTVGFVRTNPICETISSTGGVRIRKLDKARRRETRSRIPSHLAEPPPFLPVGPCVGDLLRRARHKVPPHQNLLRERWTADQQESATRTAGETDVGTIGAKVIQHALLKRLALEAAVATQDQRGVFVRHVQRQIEGGSRMHLDVAAEDPGMMRGR